MQLVQITDRSQLAEYFKQDINLHLYSLGDLDDFYWPGTKFYGIRTSTGIDKVILLYSGEGLQVLLVLTNSDVFDEHFINQLVPLIPDQVYCHLSPGLEMLFSTYYSVIDHGSHFKMSLIDLSEIKKVNTASTILITQDQLDEVQLLFDHSYPDNAFDPRMLSTGQYYGCWKNEQLVCAGGVHVYSQTYNVAALGNITTHPDYRNQGLGRTITARLCLALSERVDHIGLNVKANNEPALHLYQSLGFQISSNYGEFSLKKRVLTPK